MATTSDVRSVDDDGVIHLTVISGGIQAALDAKLDVVDAPPPFPADAEGALTNDGVGGLTWELAGAPGDHATEHENGGGDEINVAGLSGVLADPQPPIIGGGAAQAVAGNDARLTDARTPTAHDHNTLYYTEAEVDSLLAAKAAALGSDDNYATDAEKVKLTNLSGANSGDQTLPTDATIATADVTTNNATTAKHGWLQKYPGGTTTFLRADGAFAPPVAALPDLVVTANSTAGSSRTISAGYSAHVPSYYEVASGLSLEIAAGGCMEIG